MTASPGAPRFAVLNYASSASVDALERDLAAQGFEIVRLDGSQITDRDSLMAQASQQLPGFDEVQPKRWAGFNDAMPAMFFSFEDADKIALVWTNTETILERGLADFMTAADVFTCNSREAVPHGVTFVTCFVGDGPNFPAWPG